MSTATTLDRFMQRVEEGEALSPEEIHALAATPDILSIGMLADVQRRRRHGGRATFLRVAECPFDAPFEGGAPPSARELRVTGSPPTLAAAVTAVQAVRARAGDRPIAGFAWADVERWSSESPRALDELRAAGLDAIAHLPIDKLADPPAAIERLSTAGFTRIRLVVESAPADVRADLLLRAAELERRFSCIQAIAPLPAALAAFRPTTGYEDVKMVAIARLAAPEIPSVQVDWRRYGPKLAQVALTFGADDIDGISASDEAPEGSRRAPLAEIVRNIEAAGLTPAERDGRFELV